MDLINLIISPAYAETSSANPQGGGMSFMMMLIMLIFFIYFLIWRPQNKRAKEQQTLLNSISKGDEVLTVGGILGKINKISDQYIVLSIGNNVDITLQKSAIVNILPKGTLKSLD